MQMLSRGMLALLVQFTAPNGLPEWIVPSQVVLVRRAALGECAHNAPTVIVTGNNGAYCVMEDTITAEKKINEAL